ncbi:DUF1549 domain-containing protein [Planctomicrobium sp. SH668]|uniref:DUF1549 domain-containing protein n=1 Tax=Planctomicrobium sp. SH668 TaxID=3448126 RepID=UPI003F5B8632
MKTFNKQELLALVEKLCEETSTPADISRLEEIVLNSPEARKLYVEAITLHGLLYWDAAGLGALPDPSGIVKNAHFETQINSSRTPVAQATRGRFNKQAIAAVASLCAVLLIMVSVIYLNGPNAQVAAVPDQPVIEPQHDAAEESPKRNWQFSKIQLPATPPSGSVAEATGQKAVESILASNPDATASNFQPMTDDDVVERINERILAAWEEEGVTPSAAANDAEWVRRVYLDLAGRIPTASESESFLQSRDSDKRVNLVDSLLASSEFSRNMATVWTNLLVGRTREMNIDRSQLQTWLQQEFQSHQPWRETVMELVSARGTSRESGPANYLLAHLNNEAVPATAITSRIFLCEQLQCTQCHQHPTVKTWGQERFWELKAFFQQASIREKSIIDPVSGNADLVRELVDAEEVGPTFYENLRGVMKVAYPKFAGVEIPVKDLEESVSLREELAGLLFADSRPQPARAFVNRTWSQLLGYGFTIPIDDMGPHTPVSHPELLEDLTAAFVASNYDVHALVRWICLSEPYQLTSKVAKPNPLDAPEIGERPLFSRMYVKQLTAEQLYDSLRIASGASIQVLESPQSQSQRDEWLRQFYAAVETEENGESSTLDGSLSQALMMMNGELIQQATVAEEGTVLGSVLSTPALSESDRIRRLSVAALSRYPTSEELNSLKAALRRNVRKRVNEENQPPQVAMAEGLKDLYWALLNSSEFVYNH